MVLWPHPLSIGIVRNLAKSGWDVTGELHDPGKELCLNSEVKDPSIIDKGKGNGLKEKIALITLKMQKPLHSCQGLSVVLEENHRTGCSSCLSGVTVLRSYQDGGTV